MNETKGESILACPACGGELSNAGKAVACVGCGRSFKSEQGIWQVFWPTDDDASNGDVTEIVKAFYERTPFPNYDDVDSRASLIEKARQGMFAEALDAAIGESARVLDVGCGTGQLSNYLGLNAAREVFGVDVCMNSLRLAHQFRTAQKIANVTFLQMNLFRPALKPGSFDVVISNGVLHHTANPFEGFKSIARLVADGGHIVVGLYNRFGRLPLDLRRVLFRMTGDRFTWLDPRLRDPSVSQLRKQTWFMDQYHNPHESKHTIGEVLHWFERTGFEFVRSIPDSSPFVESSARSNLFEATPQGNALEHLLVQLGMVFSGGREGGFYLMIGRKQTRH